MALDISKIIQYGLPETRYYKEEKAKRIIFIHHTAGSGNPFGVIDGWKTRTDHVATAFVIAGKPKNANDKFIDGNIVQAFPSKYWANHLGLANKHFEPFGLKYKQLNDISIAIEICNWGYLTKETNGTFKNYVGGTVSADEVVELGAPYRGYKFYHKYTDAQLNSLKDLLVYLCAKYEIPKAYRENIFEVNKDCLGGVSGIWSHTSCRQDKWDCVPQLNLKNLLKTL